MKIHSNAFIVPKRELRRGRCSDLSNFASKLVTKRGIRRRMA